MGSAVLSHRQIWPWLLCKSDQTAAWPELEYASRSAFSGDRLCSRHSWPFVEYDSHNVDEQGNAKIRLVLTNQGIGPARIETLELWWNGQPVSSMRALLEACCETTKVEGVLSVGNAAPNILRAGEHEDFFAVSPGPGNVDLFKKLNAEQAKIVRESAIAPSSTSAG
jgi:hypothetical protein